MVETNTDLVEPTEAGGDEEALAIRDTFEVGQVSGEISKRDFRWPALRIVSKTSKLIENFKVGDLVLNGEYFLASRGQPIRLVVLHCDKGYREKLPYNANGPRPKLYRTLKEVIDDGKGIDWVNDMPPSAEEVATALVLIEKPADLVCLAFNNTLDGKEYAVAKWDLAGTSYTRAATQIFTKSKIELRLGLDRGLWELRVQTANVNGFAVEVPVLKLLPEATTEAFRDQARALFAPKG